MQKNYQNGWWFTAWHFVAFRTPNILCHPIFNNSGPFCIRTRILGCLLFNHNPLPTFFITGKGTLTSLMNTRPKSTLCAPTQCALSPLHTINQSSSGIFESRGYPRGCQITLRLPIFSATSGGIFCQGSLERAQKIIYLCSYDWFHAVMVTCRMPY